jgi:hypothetical protein
MSYYQIAEIAIALGFGLCARRLVGHCRTDLEALLSDILRRRERETEALTFVARQFCNLTLGGFSTFLFAS